jgi:hypothetical protein
MSWSSGFESKWGHAVNPNTTAAWFALLQKTVTDYDIAPECTYGSDEIGCNPAEGRKEHVIGGYKPGP